MSGLRGKLLLGFGALLLILVTVSVLANLVLGYYSRSNQRVLREDLSSVSAAQDMREAAIAIDADLDELTEHRRELPTAQASVERHVREFETGLRLQNSSATLPHEPETTERLARLWEQYRDAARRATADGLTDEQRLRQVRDELQPGLEQIRKLTGEISHQNLESIQAAHARAELTSGRARLAMHTLTGLGVACALAVTLLFGRMVLRPVQALTRSVQEIERGNLDLAVPVRSRDELGRLAEAFNAMAAQLRVFRRIDHEKLLRTQRTTQLAIDSLPDGVVVVNPQGSIELTNETAKRLFGLRPGQSVEAPAAGAGLPEGRLAELHRRVLAEGRLPEIGGYAGAVKVGDGNGHTRYFLPRAVPIVDDGRHVVGSALVLGDVTEFRRLDEMKNGLLSLVSHELKTPLTSMRMILPLIIEGKVGALGDRQRELLLAVREDAERLHRIVENLLDMGRLESGRGLADVHPIPAGELVERSIEPLRSSFRDAGVTLQFDDANTPAAGESVLADPVRIGHVFANLLTNALRFTPAGGTVRVGLRPAGDRVEFSVSDTGPGIPRQYVYRVFEKFFRVPGQPGESGSGLGLAIVKDVVEAHSGHVGVESTAGRGATFRFTLRLADAPITASADARSGIAAPDAGDEQVATTASPME
jgi:two-component system, NtrC family, sensor histidine kinase KinB